MRVRILGAAALLLLFYPSAFAGWARPELRWAETYRYDIREKKHDLYQNRLSATFSYLGSDEKSIFKLTTFYENWRNIDKGFSQRNFGGLEIGKDILSWLYLAESFQCGLMKEDYLYKQDFETSYYSEAETRLVLSHNLLTTKYINLKWFILYEYTYDLRRGSVTRNEAAVGLMMPVGKYIETGVDWRHIDRIQHYDSDTLEAYLTLVF